MAVLLKFLMVSSKDWLVRLKLLHELLEKKKIKKSRFVTPDIFASDYDRLILN